MIEFRNISISFDGRKIINDFSCKIERGEKAVLFSPSGTGKSVLLHLMMGFIIPDSGDIIVDGLHVNAENIRKIRLKIAWLPQNVSIIGRGLVSEALAGRLQAPVNKEFYKEFKINEYLKKVGLDGGILNSRLEDISGGEKQRVGLVLCKLLNRRIMALDEPSSALDYESKKKVIDLILGDKDITLISVSHDEEWMKSCKKHLRF